MGHHASALNTGSCDMADSEALHPTATHHLPSFITPPGQTDVLMVVTAVILVVAVVGFGLVFFRLHTLPERMAHRSHKLQFEIVAVLGLIALFTHMHIFWIAGLLLALIDIPDFGAPLRRIAGSTEKMAGLKPGEGLVEVPEESVTGTRHDAEAPEPETNDGTAPGDGRGAAVTRPAVVPARQKEVGHA
jgi:hypothetical protein